MWGSDSSNQEVGGRKIPGIWWSADASAVPFAALTQARQKNVMATKHQIHEGPSLRTNCLALLFEQIVQRVLKDAMTFCSFPHSLRDGNLVQGMTGQ